MDGSSRADRQGRAGPGLKQLLDRVQRPVKIRKEIRSPRSQNTTFVLGSSFAPQSPELKSVKKMCPL